MADTQPVKERLFAHPTRPNSYKAGGKRQVQSTTPPPPKASTPAPKARAPIPAPKGGGSSIEDLITRAAKRYHISRNILRAQLVAESGLKEGETSKAGARDIAQFMPSTAAQYHVTLGDNKPADDIMGAAHYDADLLKRYGSYKEMLSAYNSGSPTGYQRLGETSAYVRKILAAAGNPSVPSGTGGDSTTPSTGSGPTTVTTPGTSYQPDRAQAVVQWLQNRHMPGSLLTLAGQLTDIPADVPATTTRVPAAPKVPAVPTPTPKSTGTGTAKDPSGKPVADWIEQALAYARAHGWGGSVTSGYRSDAEQTAIYKRGVRPAAVPQSMGGGGSNHEFTAYPGGAVDVTQAAQLSAILAKSPYAQKLKWAGAKDPVHFSHPHNGSY